MHGVAIPAARGVRVFDEHALEYDRWFDRHPDIYQAEVRALQTFVPPAGIGIEVGAGTGRFALPLGINLGVEPSTQMARLARRRGLVVCQALGEQLPFPADQFDFVLLVTVICFVADVVRLFDEMCRVLKPGGRLVVGFIDRCSALGRLYEARRAGNKFYGEATFYAVDDVAAFAYHAGFGALQFCQTIFGEPEGSVQLERVRGGYGEGAFVVLSGRRS